MSESAKKESGFPAPDEYPEKNHFSAILNGEDPDNAVIYKDDLWYVDMQSRRPVVCNVPVCCVVLNTVCRISLASDAQSGIAACLAVLDEMSSYHVPEGPRKLIS